MVELQVIEFFADLQKAFDTVDHQILLAKLNHYEIHGVSNDQLKSYLSNCCPYASRNGYEFGGQTLWQSLVTNYWSVVTSHQLLFASYESLVTSYQLLVTSHQLLVTSYQLLVISHQLQVNSYQSLATQMRIFYSEVCENFLNSFFIGHFLNVSR